MIKKERQMKKESYSQKTYTRKELEYINKLMSHGMDRIRAEWYLNAMKTWTKEDYEKYDRFHIEMFEGEEFQGKPGRAIIKKKD